jgi:hypothetical protein
MHCKLLNAEDTELLTTSKIEAPAGLLRYGFGD